MFSLLSLLTVPTLLVLALMGKGRDVLTLLSLLWSAEWRGSIREQGYFKEASLLAKMWHQKVGQIYLKTGALEYQPREGFCSNATIRVVVGSIQKDRGSDGDCRPPVPASGRGTLPSSHASNIDNCFLPHTLDQVGSKVTTKSTLVSGKDGYEAFLAALHKTNAPDKYRVSVNFLRSALFGLPSPKWLPSCILLGLFGGHFSPIVGYLEKEDLVAVFDVNKDYGIFLVPSRRLFDAVNTLDIISMTERALIVTELQS